MRKEYDFSESTKNPYAKHLKKQVTLRLAVDERQNARLHLSVQDDGLGFSGDVSPGVGLTSMRERAAELGGTCTIEARPGTGTRVTAVLPLGS